MKQQLLEQTCTVVFLEKLQIVFTTGCTIIKHMNMVTIKLILLIINTKIKNNPAN